MPTALHSQIPDDLALIAHYQLTSTPDDTTGSYNPMQLVNTPFQDSGIYCNGIYGGGVNPDYCDAATPQLIDINMKGFAISAQFNVTEQLTNLHPVFVGGFSYRWIAFYLAPDSTVLLKYNNHNWESSDVRYTLNTWHLATITYQDSVISLYLDDTLAVVVTAELIHDSDKDIRITDLASGRVFKGILRHLKVYSQATTTTTIQAASTFQPDNFTLYQNYPNPFNPSTMISWQSPVGCRQNLKVYDVLGNEVATLVDEYRAAGRYEVEFNGSELASGIYFYKLQTGSFSQVKKMILLR